MSSAPSSLRVHMIVEYLKSTGFHLETDEVHDAGVKEILEEQFDIHQKWSEMEIDLLTDELLHLAEQNEIREAQMKMAEVFPQDTGVMKFRQEAHNPGERATGYLIPFAYPADKNLRNLGPGPNPEDLNSPGPS